VPEAPEDGLYYVRQDAAWVQSLLRASVSTVSTTTHNPATGLDGRYFRCTNAAGCEVTIPTNAAQPFDPNGYNVFYNKAGQVTMSGDFINGQLYNGRIQHYDENGLAAGTEIFTRGRSSGRAAKNTNDQ
jgi:uncharacterized protein with LGFP repeats